MILVEVHSKSMELVRWYVLPKHEPISFMHVVRHDSKDSRWRLKKIWRMFLHESFHETCKEVSEGKNHKPKKEFAYRMHARRPTAKPSFLCERTFSRSMMAMCRGEVTCFDTWGWLQGEMKKCGWLWGDVRWGNVVSREMSFDVM